MKVLFLKKHYTVALSLLLVLSILLSAVSHLTSSIFAEDIEEAYKSGAYIVSEDVTKRGEYERHYLTEDGSYVAISYSDPVNYLTDDGSWEAVDNSLSGNIFTGALTSNNEKFKVKFANKADHDKLVSVKTDGYDISWGLTVSADGDSYTELDRVKVSADTKNTNSLPKTVSDASSLGAAVSTATYENAYGDALDIRYTVTHQKVKEDVILKKPSDIISYKATYNIKGVFEAILNVDGSVTVIDGDGAELFSIGAPWMSDSSGAVSEDIAVSIVKSEKTLEVKYLLSEEWLNAPERVYPVTVDPEVTDGTEREVSSRLYSSNIEDVSVYLGGVDDTNDHLLQFNPLGMDYELYLKIHNAPVIPNDAEDLGCAFILYSTAFHNEYEGTYETEDMSVRAIEILSNWYDDAFHEYYLDNGYDGYGPVYNGDYMMEFGEVIAEASYNDVSAVQEPNLYKLEIEIEEPEIVRFGSYDSFLSTCKGLRLCLSYFMCMSIISSENTTYVNYRPAVVRRYSYTNPTTIVSGRYGRLKNVGSGKYLTIDGIGSGNGANIYQSSLNNDGNQIVKFSYNTANAYYMMMSMYNSSVSVGYSDAITEPQDTYENVKLVTSGGVVRRWLVIPDGNAYSIISELDHEHALTSMGMGSGTAQTTGMVNGNIFVSDYSENNNFQKWTFEPVSTTNIVNVTEPIYIQEGETLYLRAGSQNGVTWESSNEYVVSVNGIGAVLGKSSFGKTTISAYIAGEEAYSVEVNVALNDGTYHIRNRKNTLTNKYLYLQTNDNDRNNNFSTVGEFMELREKSNELEQRWYINYIEDGYYSIISTISGLALMIPQNKTTVNNEKIIQGVYTGGAHQLWQLQLTNTGTVRIANKATIESGRELVMSAGWAVAFANGNNVKNRNPNDVSEYYDEWYIESLGAENTFTGSERHMFYMSTADKEYISLQSPNSTGENQTVYCNATEPEAEAPEFDSSFMWRFEQVGAYYKIYSLNVANSLADDENLLLVYDNGQVTTIKSASISGDEALWKIQRGNDISTGEDNYRGNYYISPKTAPTKYLRRDYDGGIYCVKALSYNKAESVLSFYSVETYFGGALKGITGGETTIKCYVQNASWYSNVMSAEDLERIISKWNNISSNIRLEFCGVLSSNNVPPQDRYYIVFKYAAEINGGEFGETISYDFNNQSTRDLFERSAMEEEFELHWSQDWSKSEIVIRTTNWLDLNDAEKKGVILHEIGHALKLDHPNMNVLSVMQSGVGGEYHSNYITVYDIYSLKSKWGV